MQCIFCKRHLNESKSMEHIIPESLGNKDHTLPNGIVCDKCNNYFAIKIEKKLLEMPYFRGLRYQNLIESKKGNYPTWPAFIPNPPALVEFGIDKNFQPKLDIIKFIDMYPMKSISKLKNGFFTVAPDRPSMPEKNNRIISRFLGKVGIEFLASRLMDSDNGIKEIIEMKVLDPLREYVRYNKYGMVWEYNVRRIYDENKIFVKNKEEHQVLHEFNLLYTEDQELFIVLVIMGVEYCLNLGDPKIISFLKWLDKNEYQSPLYLEEMDY